MTTEQTEEKPNPETKPEERGGVVDSFFDVLTNEATRALGATERALVIVARWLDGRAKVVHDLAVKLEKTTKIENENKEEKPAAA